MGQVCPEKSGGTMKKYVHSEDCRYIKLDLEELLTKIEKYKSRMDRDIYEDLLNKEARRWSMKI